MEIDVRLRAARRMLAVREARDDLLKFNLLNMPDPEDPDDVTRSRFEVTPLARLLCQIIQRAAAGIGKKRIAVSVGPQFGKSVVLSRTAPPWIVGRDPYANIILGTYNQPFANEFGDQVREIMRSPFYQQVFPGVELRKEQVDYLATTAGGRLSFVGRGGSGSGKPADWFIIDDPIKDAAEAQSTLAREETWVWYNRIAMARCHSKSVIIVVHCLVGGTLITMADGTSRRLDEIVPGDSVIAWDGRSFVSDRVDAVIDNGIDQTYLIKTKNTEVRANAKHPFLVLSKRGLRWVLTSQLRPGMHIVRYGTEAIKEFRALSGNAVDQQNAGACVRNAIGRQWLQRATNRLHWQVWHVWRGVVNGVTELARKLSTGCSQIRTVFAPFAKQMVAKAGQGIGSPTSFQITITRPENSAGYYATTATGSPDELEIPPFWNEPSNTSGLDTDEVVSIEPYARERVFDLTVADNHNFIANGLCAKNTRWNGDDLIGRLVDPDHPEREKTLKGFAKYWDYYCLPAVVDDPKLAKALNLTLEEPTDPDVISMFGCKPMSSLWPNRKSLGFLAEAKVMDPFGFNSLYMGKPTADDGEYFKAEWLLEYDPEDLPKKLTCYGASDHAVSVRQGKDYTVIGCVGVDEKDDIWVLPSLVWDRIQTDRTVEEILAQMEINKPVCWWMESELISKSFGPFLYKRMDEKRVYVPIDPITPSKDKRTMARAIQGRMQMRKVHFPRFAHWWQDARAQLLRFDSGAYDDFVSFMSMIGMGMFKQFVPDDVADVVELPHRSGSIEWILNRTAQDVQRGKQRKAIAGW